VGEFLKGVLTFSTNNNGWQILTMVERPHQTCQVECGSVPHLMIEYEELIWNLAFDEHLCRKTVRA